MRNVEINFDGGISLGISVAVVTIWLLHRFYKNVQEKARLAKLRAKKQKERQMQFQDFKNKYKANDEDHKILELSFSELRQKLQTRELKSTQVLKAFIGKSLEVQNKCNCITEFVPGAMSKATALDKLDTVKGPLHGIPFCVKDDTNVEGMDSTIGFSSLLYKPVEKSAVIVQILENLGALPFARTNLPQGCLSLGSDNPIFGQTVNPLKKKLCPGGSSSGTACLVAAGGCHFGTGTDSGGSLRIPAHCCGLTTLKATFNRLSDDGCLHCAPNLTTVPGIITKKADDLAFIYELIIKYHNQNPLDLRVPQILWNNDGISSKKELKIGWYCSLAGFSPVGDIPLSIEKAKKHLEKLGHTVVPFKMPDHTKVWLSTLMDERMFKNFMEGIKNDAVGECVKSVKTMATLFPVLYQFVRVQIFVCKKLGITTELGREFPVCPETEKEAMCKAVLKEMEKENLDILLCPTLPFVAVGVNDIAPISMKLQSTMFYPFLWNLVNFPAGVVKFGEESGENWPKNDPIFTPRKQDSIGMPIGLQIVGKPFQEELVLRILKEMDQFNGN